MGKAIERADPSVGIVGFVSASTGAVLSREQFVARHAAWRATFGSLTPQLADWLQQAQPSEQQIVSVALNIPDRSEATRDVVAQFPTARFVGDRPDTGDDALNQVVRTALRDAHVAATDRLTQAFIEQVSPLGLKLNYAGRLAPMIWFTGNSKQIQQLVANPAVVQADLAAPTVLTMSDVGPYDQATNYSHPLGHTGAGSAIAVVEYHNVDWTASDLSSVPSSRWEEWSTTTQKPRNSHPTWVMGAIASQTAGRKGIAPGAYYVSSSTGGYDNGVSGQYDYLVMAAIDNAVISTKGNADVVSLSFVQDTGQNGRSGTGAIQMKAYIDEVVRTYDVHVAASGGNTANCSDSVVKSPGTAWNVTTVGGIDNGNATDWSSDSVWTGHCYLDPPGGTFKPEISAPAVCVQVTGTTCSGSNGVSIAVPQVAGTLGVMIGVNPGDLRLWPEKTKAILLASSHVHRVDSNAADNTVAPSLDDREGIGSLTTKWADIVSSERVLNGAPLGNSGTKQFYAGSSNGCYQLPAPQSETVTNLATRKMRFAITWQSHGFYSPGSDGYGTNDSRNDARYSDIDLYVYTASGALKGSSLASTWNSEWVEWTVSDAEQPYRVEVRPFSWDCSIPNEIVGWSWVAWSGP